MDLFVDEYYKLECKEQINYYDMLYSVPNKTLPSGYSVVGDITIVFVKSGYALVKGIGHIKKTDGQYCHEVQITNVIKKIILEKNNK